jgi:hypothetical protein
MSVARCSECKFFAAGKSEDGDEMAVVAILGNALVAANAVAAEVAKGEG